MKEIFLAGALALAGLGCESASIETKMDGGAQRPPRSVVLKCAEYVRERMKKQLLRSDEILNVDLIEIECEQIGNIQKDCEDEYAQTGQFPGARQGPPMDGRIAGSQFL